jgi:hypothetical protein
MGEIRADTTFFELMEAAKLRAEAKRNEATGGPAGNAAREFAIALTSLEDAQMRYTRGVSMMLGVFRPVDLESVDAIADRRAFLDSVEAAGA